MGERRVDFGASLGVAGLPQSRKDGFDYRGTVYLQARSKEVLERVGSREARRRRM